MSTARTVLAAGLVVVAQVLDATVLARTTWPLATPDVTLLVVVALGLLGGSRSGAVVGLVAGLVADLTPPGSGLLGVTAVAYGLAGAVAGRWHRPGERSVVLVLIAAGAAAVTATGVQALVCLASGACGVGRAAGLVLGGTLYAVAGSLLVVPLVIVLDRVVEGDAPEVVRL